MADHEHHHQAAQQKGPAPRTPRYKPTDEVDFVIVGSGSSGGVVARELSRAGFSVLVLEQGPRFTEKDFHHDEVEVLQNNKLTNNHKTQPNTWRKTEKDKAIVRPSVQYGRAVGGGSLHFTANFWRFHEIDFKERSKVGAIEGADFADWPITYQDLEPYYSMVEWEVGVSGQAGVSPFDPPRTRGYPVPPLPIKSTGVLMERGAKKLGWTAFPAPMAILSRPYKGRSGCAACGFCMGFGCEVRAKSSTLVTMIPEAEATGKCEIRPNCYVRKVEINDKGRVTGVIYFDKDKNEVFQRAKVVVLSANGAETAKLLLMSKSNRFPQGLANSSGAVGRHLMYNGGGVAMGRFEHEVNAYKGAEVSRIVHDMYELDPAKVGFHGGGGLDFRFGWTPIQYALVGQPPDGPTWGSAYKKDLHDWFTRTVSCFWHSTSLPVPTNRIELDDEVKDAWGLPAIRLTFNNHPNDRKVFQWFNERSVELLDAAGSLKSWHFPVGEDDGVGGPHLLGTCRMGNDPSSSVVNKSHRAHDVPNLFLVDGSSFVTGGRGQPTMTIMALAFRAAAEMTRMAKAGELAG